MLIVHGVNSTQNEIFSSELTQTDTYRNKHDKGNKDKNRVFDRRHFVFDIFRSCVGSLLFVVVAYLGISSMSISLLTNLRSPFS